MAIFSIQDYRNVALVGHGGAGKTTLAEACLFKAGVTKRQGSVPEQTSCLDFSEEEKEKGCSLDSAVCSLGHSGKHINLIDTPGSTDFCGTAIASLAGVETAILVVSAAAGIEVNTRKMMQRAADYGVARMVVINKIDAETANLEELLGQIQEAFGSECVPINLTTGNRSGVVGCLAAESGAVDFGDFASAREAVLEAIVGVDDELMEKYLGGEASADEIIAAAPAAMAAGVLIPVLFTNARDGLGLTELLDAIVNLCPDPTVGKRRTITDGETETEVAPAAEGGFIAQAFKNTSDPKSNIKYSLIRVHRGKLTSDQSIKTTSEPKGVRPGQIMRFRGVEHEELEAAVAGDVIGLAKLELHIGDLVYTADRGTMAMPLTPKPMFALAVEPKARGDEDKISAALKHYADEDPCFQVERNASTHELVVRGVGDMHLRTVLGRMARYHHLEVETRKPKIPYHETIMGTAKDVEYTHKKQTGGAGQYARVIINLMPQERGAGYEFADKIFGGAIDQAFRPSVDKGIKAQMIEGVLAGYPVVDVKAELIDGKTHPVDSKDIAFQIAGREAFKAAFMQAKPVLLEPIVQIEVTAPTENVGDLQGDLASRRGRPQGQDMLPGGLSVIQALVPLAEVADYHSRLSSITGGRGSYALEFSHYEQVPGNVQQQIIAEAKKPSE
ncbi:MAG: elongation factor G [Planctomycetota bacterium]|jgi:elongation factor G